MALSAHAATEPKAVRLGDRVLATVYDDAREERAERARNAALAIEELRAELFAPFNRRKAVLCGPAPAKKARRQARKESA